MDKFLSKLWSKFHHLQPSFQLQHGATFGFFCHVSPDPDLTCCVAVCLIHFDLTASHNDYDCASLWFTFTVTAERASTLDKTHWNLTTNSKRNAKNHPKSMKTCFIANIAFIFAWVCSKNIFQKVVSPCTVCTRDTPVHSTWNTYCASIPIIFHSMKLW